MKSIIYIITMVIGLIAIVHAGDYLGDYLNDQVPQDYEYPLWLTIFAEYVLRLMIGGTIFFSVSGCPEKRLSSFRGFAGVAISLVFLASSVMFDDVYDRVLELGIKGIALLVGGLLLFGFVLRPVINGLEKLRSK